MTSSDSIKKIADKVWAWRQQNGYLKSLPKEIRSECCEVISAGETQTDVAKAVGVSPKSVFTWYDKYKSEKEFSNKFIELKKTDGATDKSAESTAFESKYKIHLSMQAQGCQIEITGCDFSTINRLMKKLEK